MEQQQILQLKRYKSLVVTTSEQRDIKSDELVFDKFRKQAAKRYPKVSKKLEKQRSFYTDWMRSTGIYLVVVLHICVSVERTVKLDNYQKERITTFYRSLLQFIMPMFFYLSGRSSAFGSDTYLVFIKKKFLRLIVPLIFGTLFIVIPTAYIGRIYRPQTNQSLDMSFLNFIGRYFQDEFPRNGFEWLWFLPVLFSISIINYPTTKLFKELYNKDTQIQQLNSDNTKYLIYVYVYIGIFILLSILVGVHWALVLIGTLFYTLYLILLHLIQLLRKHVMLTPLFTPCIMTSLVLAFLQPQLNGFSQPSQLICMVMYYNMFYCMGFMDQTLHEEYKFYKQQTKHLRLRPLALFLLLFFMALCSPGDQQDVGYVFMYPIYTSPWIRVSFVGGTWLWIALILRWCQTFYNLELNSTQYKFFVNSSILFYLIHWFFIEIPNRYIVHSYQLPLIPAIIILTIFTIAGCTLTFIIANKIPLIGFLFGLETKKKKNLTQNQKYRKEVQIEIVTDRETEEKKQKEIELV